MYLKIHPLEHLEHGLKHSEVVRNLEGRVEHKEPHLDHSPDDDLEDVVVIQEHNLETNLDGPLENGAEHMQGVE